MPALSPDALKAFLEFDEDSEVVMLNLIRFVPGDGRDRYFRYLTMVQPILARFEAKILFGGDGHAVLTEGQEQGWDVAVLVQYPRRSTFMTMVADPEYQEAFEVGISAIADITLQPLTKIKILG